MRAAELLEDYDLDDAATMRWFAEQDHERIAHALRRACRKSRAPVFARDALERHEIAPGSDTDTLLVAAAEHWWLMRPTDCPNYLVDALTGVGGLGAEGERVPPVLPQRLG